MLAVEMSLRRTRVRSRPIVVKVEPTNVCNFRCPGCRTGSREDTSPRGRVALDDFRTIVDRTAKHALKLILYMWGEPLIHPDIVAMIRYAAAKNLCVQISSNLNVFRPGDAEALVDSGLEHLIVAMDGVSQEVYETYRVGGRVQTVVDNVRAVLQARQQRRRRSPRVELQYIAFPHNRHEIPQMRELAAGLGVDVLTIIDSAADPRPSTPPGDGPAARGDSCNMLWMMGCFNWDGSFSPCCDSVDDSFGNILQSDLATLWNSDKMRKSRSLFTRNPRADGPATKCSRCRIRGQSVTFLREKEQP
jgi:MoaA/NifB/PqqE/SkfB family radical SAM enzyme